MATFNGHLRKNKASIQELVRLIFIKQYGLLINEFFFLQNMFT